MAGAGTSGFQTRPPVAGPVQGEQGEHCQVQCRLQEDPRPAVLAGGERGLVLNLRTPGPQGGNHAAGVMWINSPAKAHLTRITR